VRNIIIIIPGRLEIRLQKYKKRTLSTISAAMNVITVIKIFDFPDDE